MKTNTSLFLFFLFPVLLFGQSSADMKVRLKMKFNADWKFALDDKAGFEATSFDDAAWRSLDLPHDWGVEGQFDAKNPATGLGAFLPCGIGWYRKSFVLPDSLKSKRVVIQFDGVYMNSKVYLNGHFLGQYPYGYTTFQIDLTAHLHFGKPNVLAVRVDNSLQPSSRWYSGSGIYRNVWLMATNQVHFDNAAGVFVSYPAVSKDNAEIKVQYKVTANAFPTSDFQWWRRNISSNVRVTKEVTISSFLFDSKGKMVAKVSSKHNIGDFDDTTFSQAIALKNPSLWSAGTPVTYTLKTTLEYDGRVMDDYSTKIGIRSVVFTPEKGMLINGVQEKIKGVCLHQDAGSLGVAAPIGVWEQRLLKLKEMGANAVRLSHHPFAPEFYDLCDSLGLYVMDEAFDEWNKGYNWGTTENTYGKIDYGYHLYFNQWAETDLRTMIRRDRNHPSVIMYSIGNEIPNQRTPDGVEIAQKLQNICHQEDPTRLVTSASDFVEDANANGFLSALDIAGYNYVDRYNGENMYATERAKYPKRLLLGTETFHGNRYWLAVRDNANVIGEFVWVGYDYLGEAFKWPKRGWDAGLIDMAGTPYPEYYLRKSYWSEEPVVQVAIETSKTPEGEWHPRKAVSHWNHKWVGDYLLPLYVYSNCDEVELLVNDLLISRKAVDKNRYYAYWDVPFKAGKVHAIGYKNGIKVTEQTLKTAGDAVGMSISANKIKLKADLEDVIMLEVSIVDANGILVPDAVKELTVKLTGPAKLIGLDNGNQSDVSVFKTNTRKAFGGRILVTIQATAGEGKVKIEVISAGLKPAEYSIQAISSRP
jgi:beta-galactosidase